MKNLSNEAVTTALVAVFVLGIAVGVGLIAGLGAGLIVGGLLGVAWVVLFVRDVSPPVVQRGRP